MFSASLRKGTMMVILIEFVGMVDAELLTLFQPLIVKIKKMK